MIGNILSHSRVRKGNVVYRGRILPRYKRGLRAVTFDIHTPGTLTAAVRVYAFERVRPRYFPLKLGSARHLAGGEGRGLSISFARLSSLTTRPELRGAGAVVVSFVVGNAWSNSSSENRKLVSRHERISSLTTRPI